MIDELPIQNIFKTVCIGRYQVDLPNNATLVDGQFKSYDLRTLFDDPKLKKSQTFSGKNRYQNWLTYVEKQKSGHSSPASIIRNSKNDLSHITTLKWILTGPDNNPDPTDMTETLAYRDFPNIELGLGFLLAANERT
ncbi:hypothetical protein [Pelagibaculum spongiae]|uniref:Uncharacterized protein n=1 Tax=Pelagibaculum spongiae TaxID=2080658 RepID=A0A2V1H230_9GAMM|nr:hypothetical protein [Pelagibaculum spongiae]PVZ72020.1 hypothetical protein DC094_03090 [Pelagibaculum spongiae]